jgi:DNA-binding NtrC family response regulator
MQRIRSEIRSLAPLRGAVLISGESGTGKDLVARALHEQSGRSGRYCPLNVAALSESLLDAELFGHEKGAFTGAAVARRGLFEVAHQGTLFLDEIAELSPAGQAKLLRVVEDGHVRAVGAEASRLVNVRLISATCRSLDEQIIKGAFREDLFHRLAMLEISLPPLRKRTEDIPLLARHYLNKLKPELGEKHLDPAAEEVLRHKPWKGNIRELFGTLYRVAALTDEDLLGPSHFGPASQKVPQRPRLLPERAMELLDIHGSVSAAARAAGVPRTTFRSVIERRALR